MCFPCMPQAAAPIPTSREPHQLSVHPSSPGSHNPLIRKGKTRGRKLFYFRDAGQEGLPMWGEFGPPASLLGRSPYGNQLALGKRHLAFLLLGGWMLEGCALLSSSFLGCSFLRLARSEVGWWYARLRFCDCYINQQKEKCAFSGLLL